MRRAFAIDEKAFGPMHSSVAIDLGNLAQLLKTTNRPAETESLMRRALAINETVFGSLHHAFASSLSNLAEFLLENTRTGTDSYTKPLQLTRRDPAPNIPTWQPT